MKMIIRNCPCFVEGIAIKGSEQKAQTCNNHKIRELTYCADCTDCVLKQIVKLCGKYHVIDAGYQKVAINYLSSDILKLLDIQEVE